jgi:outer membrane receptor for ferrienterochelin and colicins
VVPLVLRTRPLAAFAATCWLAACPFVCAGQTLAVSAPDERGLLADVPSVFTASKYDQPASDAPADVSVVTRAEILRFGWLTIAEVLRGVRSFLVTSDRNYAYAGVRGAVRTGDYNGRILLLVDGHRVNDTIYDQALLGTEGPVDMELVERIEIVRGAGSSIYGSNAFFGVINVITRRGREVGGVEVGALVGSEGTYGGRLTAGNRLGSNSEYLVSATAGQTDGQRNIDFPVFGTATHQDADRWVKALAQWRTGDVALSAVFDQRTKHVPTAPFNSVFADGRNETTDTRAWIEARYDTVLAGGDLTARAAYDDYRYQGNLVTALAPDTINQDRSHATWWTAEATWSRNLADDLRLLVGAEAQSDITNRQENGDRSYAGDAPTDYRRFFLATDSTRYWAVYAQLEWNIAPGLDTSLGVRHDQYSSFGGVTEPRLALIGHPSDDLTLKLIYGQAFRAPNDYELYYNDGGISQKANPDLQPERIRTTEALVEWRFARDWRAVGAFFFNRITDQVTTVTDPRDGLLVNVNSMSQIGRGLEAEVEGRTGFGLEVFGAATTQLGEIGVGAPRTQLKGRLAQSFLDSRAIAALEAIYVSGRQTLLGTTVPAQTLTNLVLTAQNFWPGVRLTAAALNLFDAQLADPAGPEHRQDRIPRPGRQFWLKLDLAFP